MAENSVKGPLYKARLAMYNVQEANLVIKCKKNKWILIIIILLRCTRQMQISHFSEILKKFAHAGRFRKEFKMKIVVLAG